MRSKRLVDLIDGESGHTLMRASREAIRDVSRPGRVDDAVAFWVKYVQFVADDATLERYVRSSGAEPSESVEDTRARAFWIAAGSYTEEQRQPRPRRTPRKNPGDINDRVAKALGWKRSDVTSFSRQALRDLVRPIDPALADELSASIQSGAYIRGNPRLTPTSARMMKRSGKFKKPYHITKWEERDRVHIALVDDDDRTIVEWWDDEAREAFEDGFLDRRRLQQSAEEYAQHMGLL